MDEFPVLEQELSELPDELMRTLFDALRLSVRVNKLTNRARVDLVLTDKGLNTVRGFSTNAFSALNGSQFELAQRTLEVRCECHFGSGGSDSVLVAKMRLGCPYDDAEGCLQKGLGLWCKDGSGTSDRDLKHRRWL